MSEVLEKVARAIGIRRAGPLGILPVSMAQNMPLSHFADEQDLLADARAALEVARTEALRAIMERRDSYVNAKAPGWYEVKHECDQCIAAVTAALRPDRV